MLEYNPNCPKLEDLDIDFPQIEFLEDFGYGYKKYGYCPIPVPEAFGESI